MVEQIGVAVAHDDRAVVEQVVEAVERAPGLYVVAASTEAATGGQVVVAGGDALWEALPGRPLVALADGDVLGAARAALAGGARDIVAWPGEADRLPGAIRRALSAASVRESGTGTGRVVAVAGARGGVGVSTLVAGLGAAFDDAVVMDLDGAGAGQRAFLSGEPAHTVEELRPALAGVQPDVLTNALTPHAGGARALHATPGMPPLTAEAVRGLVRAAREVAPATVLDLGRGAGEGAHAALTAADVRLLVVANDVASIRGARDLLDRHRGPFEVVVRRARRVGVAARDIATSLGGGAITAVVPDDPALARAVDLGTLPDRPTRAMRAFTKLARALEGSA